MADERRPSVIVSDLEVVYRVFGAKKRGGAKGKGRSSLLQRLLRLGTRGNKVGATEVRAVKGVSFVAHEGESIGIIGRNGSGKSTLLRAVAGLLPPTKGRVWVDGRAALLGVNAVLIPGLSGERNVMIGGQALGLSPHEVRQRYQEIVDFSGLEDHIHMPMSSYSSGMAARLRFAISTAAVPDVLIVDEALATGDATFKARSRERIKEIREHAGTVFLVSHSNQQIRSICNRVLWMDDGKIIMDGPPEKVVSAYARSTGHRAGNMVGSRGGKKKGRRRNKGGTGAGGGGRRRAAAAREQREAERDRRRRLRPSTPREASQRRGGRPFIAGERKRPETASSTRASATTSSSRSLRAPSTPGPTRPAGPASGNGKDPDRRTTQPVRGAR